jgi:hypothetical protein
VEARDRISHQGVPRRLIRFQEFFSSVRNDIMRTFILVLFALIFLAACGRVDSNESQSIAFLTTPVQSQSLLVKAQLKCYPGEQYLKLNLSLRSFVPENIFVKEIVLSNLNGMNSLAERNGNKPLSIIANKDTTFQLTFNPINDKSLFQVTGLHGSIDSAYNLAVYYAIEGKEGLRVINLVSRMPMEKFLSYKKIYDIPVQIYYLNVSNGFDEKQRKFLTANSISTETSPFVHITEQELALSGLNFRIKCFHRNDSLHIEMFVVNHSDMTIKIETSKMELLVDGLASKMVDAELSNTKVTGSKDEADILRKGDRTIIKMQKYVRETPKSLALVIAESFFLTTGKPLFNDNLELIPFSDKLQP